MPLPTPPPDERMYDLIMQAVHHPVTYGILSGVARFLIGDRSAGWKALTTNVLLSMFVALGGMFYLADESYTDGKKTFFIIVASFLARDVLVAILSIAAEFSKDPVNFFARMKAAFKGAQP